MHCVDLGENFQTHIYLQILASIRPTTRPYCPAWYGDSLRAAFGLPSASGAPGDASRDRRVVQSGNQETDHKKYTKNMSGLRKRLQNAITKRPTPFAQHKFLEVVDEDTCYSDILLFFNTNFPMNAFPHECILYDGIPGFPLVNKKKRNTKYAA